MRRALLAAAFAAMASSGAPAQVAAPAATTIGPDLAPPDATLVAAGPSPTLTFVYSGDVIGYVDPCG